MKNDLPIGVFDSGIGGLTVVKEIMKRLPHERIIYFGDTARVPYGNKSRDTIITYCRQIMRFLLGDGEPKIKAVVVACNTASALALDTIAKDSPVPVIGVVGPGAKAAIEATRNGRIGVIQTIVGIPLFCISSNTSIRRFVLQTLGSSILHRSSS